MRPSVVYWVIVYIFKLARNNYNGRNIFDLKLVGLISYFSLTTWDVRLVNEHGGANANLIALKVSFIVLELVCPCDCAFLSIFLVLLWLTCYMMLSKNWKRWRKQNSISLGGLKAEYAFTLGWLKCSTSGSSTKEPPP